MATRGGTRWTKAGAVTTTTRGAFTVLRAASADKAAMRAAPTLGDGPIRS